MWVNFQCDTWVPVMKWKYLIWDSLFCSALSSVHETFTTVRWCHTLFAPKAVCPKSCTKLYQEPEKVPSLENSSTTPMPTTVDCCKEANSRKHRSNQGKGQI